MLSHLIMYTLFLSSLYILIALGLTLIFGIMDIVNFAHGAFAILGAYICYTIAKKVGIDPFLALIFVIFLMIIVGFITFETFARFTLDIGDVHVIYYYALLIVISNIIALFFGYDYYSMSSQLGYKMVNIGFLKYNLLKLLIIILSLSMTSGIAFFLKFSMIGKKIRAVAQNKGVTEILGINPLPLIRITWILSIVSAGLFGAIIGMIDPFSPYSSGQYLMIAFSVSILGGMGSVFGSIIGGFILGALVAFSSFLLSPQISQILFFIVIIIVLLIKPMGLFGR